MQGVVGRHPQSLASPTAKPSLRHPSITITSIISHHIINHIVTLLCAVGSAASKPTRRVGSPVSSSHCLFVLVVLVLVVCASLRMRAFCSCFGVGVGAGIASERATTASFRAAPQRARAAAAAVAQTPFTVDTSLPRGRRPAAAARPHPPTATQSPPTLVTVTSSCGWRRRFRAARRGGARWAASSPFWSWLVWFWVELVVILV